MKKSLKCIISFAIIVAVCLCQTVITASAVASEISTDKQLYNIGDNLNISISFSADEAMTALEAYIHFDKSALSFQGGSSCALKGDTIYLATSVSAESIYTATLNFTVISESSSVIRVYDVFYIDNSDDINVQLKPLPEATAEIKVQPLAPNSPQILFTNGDTVVLKKVEGVEYSMDGNSWQSYNVFSGLSKDKLYAFYARIAESGGTPASQSSTPKYFMSVSAPEPSLMGETIATFKEKNGYLHSVDTADWYSDGKISGLHSGVNYTAFKKPILEEENVDFYYEGVTFSLNGNDDYTEMLPADMFLIIIDHILKDGNNLAADINGDGIVNLIDLVRYRVYLLNL